MKREQKNDTLHTDKDKKQKAKIAQFKNLALIFIVN